MRKIYLITDSDQWQSFDSIQVNAITGNKKKAEAYYKKACKRKDVDKGEGSGDIVVTLWSVEEYFAPDFDQHWYWNADKIECSCE